MTTSDWPVETHESEPNRVSATDRSLIGRVALVTGAGRGIGRSIAVRLARAGAEIVVNDVDPTSLAETVRLLEGVGCDAEAMASSVTDSHFADTIVAQALEAHGAVDIVVNNAGYTWDAGIHRMSDEQWEAMLDVHMTAPFRLLRRLAPVFRDQRLRDDRSGRTIHRKVVNVTSVSGIAGLAGQANYAAAKSGLDGLTRALAREWGRHLVNVNSVAFGLIDTRLTRPPDEPDGSRPAVHMDSERHRALEEAIPLGRAATPDEAAGAVYLLCTPDADYISGQVLLCTGGAPL